MMATIRIDDEVYESLKKRAEAFVDSPNSVLRRLLELDAPATDPESPALQFEIRKRTKAIRARSGELLDRHEYDLPILAVLDRRGGSAHAPDVVEEGGTLIADKLTDKDKETNKSGVVRWKNRVMWRRFNLVQMGLLKDDSQRGIWEISDAGRTTLGRGEVDYNGRGRERVS